MASGVSSSSSSSAGAAVRCCCCCAAAAARRFRSLRAFFSCLISLSVGSRPSCSRRAARIFSVDAMNPAVGQKRCFFLLRMDVYLNAHNLMRSVPTADRPPVTPNASRRSSLHLDFSAEAPISTLLIALSFFFLEASCIAGVLLAVDVRSAVVWKEQSSDGVRVQSELRSGQNKSKEQGANEQALQGKSAAARKEEEEQVVRVVVA